MRREEFLTAEFRSRDVPQCVAIAQDSVDTIYEIYSSPTGTPLQRYSCVAYLTAALIALVGVLLGPRADYEILVKATKAFRRSLEVLNSIARTLRLARSNLKKLERAISFAEKIAQAYEVDMLSDGLDGTFGESGTNSKDHIDLMALPDPEGAMPMNISLDDFDDGPVRMMLTPAFDVHYWDSQILDL